MRGFLFSERYVRTPNVDHESDAIFSRRGSLRYNVLPGCDISQETRQR